MNGNGGLGGVQMNSRGSAGPSPGPSRVPQVGRAVTEIGSVSERLAALSRQLSERLNPVLKPQPANQGTTPCGEKEIQAPLAVAMGGIASQLSDTACDLQDLIDRLEV